MMVKVFVRCKRGDLKKVLDALRTKGFNLEYHAKTENPTGYFIIIGTICRDKISEAQNIDGVLGIWEDHQFEILS